MTVSEFAAFMRGFAAFHGAAEDEIEDDEYARALAEEMAAGRA